jgi:hypothetical protein
MGSSILENAIEAKSTHRPNRERLRQFLTVTSLTLAGVVVLTLLIWQGLKTAGNPNPLEVSPGSTAAVLDIGVLVFRGGWNAFWSSPQLRQAQRAQ